MRVFVLPVCMPCVPSRSAPKSYGLVAFDSRLSSQSNQSKRDGHELLLQIFVHVRFILCVCHVHGWRANNTAPTSKQTSAIAATSLHAAYSVLHVLIHDALLHGLAKSQAACRMLGYCHARCWAIPQLLLALVNSRTPRCRYAHISVRWCRKSRSKDTDDIA